MDPSDKRQYLYSLSFISTNYPCNKRKIPEKNKITSVGKLKEQCDEVIDSIKDIELKDKISLECQNYDDTLHFGYLLIKTHYP